MSAHDVHSRLKPVFAVCAFLLALAWAPMTSHHLLESAGWIHHDGPDGDHGLGHEAADGIARLHDGGILLKTPTLFWIGWIVALVELSISGLLLACFVPSYLRRATESPPGFERTWQFVLRLALPGRAPSYAL
jgi:hypothetical protein